VDKWDFTSKDKNLFPIKLHDRGTGYGFCPAKVTWDLGIRSLYDTLVLSYETKTMLYNGGIAEQPGWFADMLAWFVPRYDEIKFYSRARAILGDGKSTKKITQ